jgi:hypothetical protein
MISWFLLIECGNKQIGFRVSFPSQTEAKSVDENGQSGKVLEQARVFKPLRGCVHVDFSWLDSIGHSAVLDLVFLGRVKPVERLAIEFDRQAFKKTLGAGPITGFSARGVGQAFF